VRAGAAEQAGADAADQDTAGEGGVQPVHDPDPVQRLEPRGMSVDRDVQEAGADPDDRQKEDQHRNGVREPWKPFHRAEEQEENRD